MSTEEIIYHPFSKEEFETLKEVERQVTTFIPKELMGTIWQSYRLIAKSNEPQPCGCKSSAKHWGRAMETIRTFVNARK
jgi:hypothetical protein